MDPYFNRPEVSNSDLSWLKKQLTSDNDYDPTEAYRFGSLIDAILTEPERVDFFKMKVDDEYYKKEDWEKAIQMQKAFKNDQFCQNILKQSSTQEIMIQNRLFHYEGFSFQMDVRCKWDLWMKALNWGGDIKSTTATTQKQFEEAVRYFDYDRQRAWYMDIAGSEKDILIGISKVNFKIFKVPINRGDELYRVGKSKYEYLAFQWWSLLS